MREYTDFDLERIGSLLWDKIYAEEFGATGFKNKSKSAADIEAAIDKMFFVPVEGPSKGFLREAPFSVQEKNRRAFYKKYQNITIELDNNKIDPATNKEKLGDWRKMCVDYYAYAIFNEQCTEFDQWVIIDYALLKRYIAHGRISIIPPKYNQTHGSASFISINFDYLPKNVISASFGLQR